MKFTFSDKKITAKDTLAVVCVEKGATRLKEKGDGRCVLEFVVGKPSGITLRKFVLLPRKILKHARDNKFRRVALTYSDFSVLSNLSERETGSLLAQNFEMANYQHTAHKTPPKGGFDKIEEVVVRHAPAAAREGFKKGQIIGEGVNACRELSNTPGGDMTPLRLAQAAQKAVKNTPVKVRVLKKPDLERLRMGALLGVARGSKEQPCFIVMEYWGAGKEKGKPFVLAGKGVTFDTGGLNLKPSDGIMGMHLDMSGGAAVIHAIAIAAHLKLKRNIIGLIPAVENMPSGESYRPGDVLKSMSGKTIEVLNTDAEGRIILADALTYAQRYNPRLVIDVATLTGGALVALGQRASVIMTKDEKTQILLQQMGEESGDYVWPLPLWEEYEEDIKGTFGDIANLQSSGKQSYASAIIGGVFLQQFAKEYPWVHIDIAPRMTTIPSDYLSPGAAGAPVRLLVKLIEHSSEPR